MTWEGIMRRVFPPRLRRWWRRAARVDMGDLRSMEPASRLMGTVVAAPFEEGDRVSDGQVLVRIDDRDLAARRSQVESRVGEAEVLLRDAETNLARMRTLEAERAIAGIQLEQAQTGQARAAAGVESARAALRELEANAAYGTITAPFAGEIVRKNLSVGDVATPGVPLFVLEDLSRIRVVASVGEAAAARLRPGASVASKRTQSIVPVWPRNWLATTACVASEGSSRRAPTRSSSRSAGASSQRPSNRTPARCAVSAMAWRSGRRSKTASAITLWPAARPRAASARACA